MYLKHITGCATMYTDCDKKQYLISKTEARTTCTGFIINC